MSFSQKNYRDVLSEILHDAEKRLEDTYGEQVMAGRHSIVKDFLDALVSCGEMTDLNRRRIEENNDLKDFFPMTPEEMEMEMEDEVFEGRTTFPTEVCEETVDFIVRYIRAEWSSDLVVYGAGTDRSHGMQRAPWIIARRCSGDSDDTPRISLGITGVVTGTYSDGDKYKISLPGERFKELDKLLTII